MKEHSKSSIFSGIKFKYLRGFVTPHPRPPSNTTPYAGFHGVRAGKHYVDAPEDPIHLMVSTCARKAQREHTRRAHVNECMWHQGMGALVGLRAMESGLGVGHTQPAQRSAKIAHPRWSERRRRVLGVTRTKGRR